MGSAGYGNHDAKPPGAGEPGRVGPAGGAGQRSSSPGALGVTPQGRSVPGPQATGADEAATAKPDRRDVATPGEGASRIPGTEQGDEVDPGAG